jgi:hypothetical protein
LGGATTVTAGKTVLGASGFGLSTSCAAARPVAAKMHTDASHTDRAFVERLRII